MNLLIVEDIIEQASAIKNTIQDQYPSYDVYPCYNYEEALNIIALHHIDIFILDIGLGDESTEDGISLARFIRSKREYSVTPILFLTAIPSKIHEAINDIHCYSYLIKPYSEADLLKSLSALHRTTLVTPQTLEIRDPNGIYYHLAISDIVYVEICNHRLSIHTKSNTFETNQYTISSFCDKTNNCLIQCHKSFAINPEKVTVFSSTHITVSTNNSSMEIPIGRKFKEKTFKVLSHE